MVSAASVTGARSSFPVNTAAPKRFPHGGDLALLLVPPTGIRQRQLTEICKESPRLYPRRIRETGCVPLPRILAALQPTPEQRGTVCMPRLEASRDSLPVPEPVAQRGSVVVFARSGDQSVLGTGLLRSPSRSRSLSASLPCSQQGPVHLMLGPQTQNS